MVTVSMVKTPVVFENERGSDSDVDVCFQLYEFGGGFASAEQINFTLEPFFTEVPPSILI